MPKDELATWVDNPDIFGIPSDLAGRIDAFIAAGKAQLRASGDRSAATNWDAAFKGLSRYNWNDLRDNRGAGSRARTNPATTMANLMAELEGDTPPTSLSCSLLTNWWADRADERRELSDALCARRARIRLFLAGYDFDDPGLIATMCAEIRGTAAVSQAASAAAPPVQHSSAERAPPPPTAPPASRPPALDRLVQFEAHWRTPNDPDAERDLIGSFVFGQDETSHRAVKYAIRPDTLHLRIWHGHTNVIQPSLNDRTMHRHPIVRSQDGKHSMKLAAHPRLSPEYPDAWVIGCDQSGEPLRGRYTNIKLCGLRGEPVAEDRLDLAVTLCGFDVDWDGRRDAMPDANTDKVRDQWVRVRGLVGLARDGGEIVLKSVALTDIGS